MIQSLYNAASGLSTQQKNIDTIANNVANINTTGFKRSRADFKDAIYASMQRPVVDGQDPNLQQGHGVLLAGITKYLTEAPLERTEGELDFAIVGKGFFAVDSGEEILYTRNGNFKASDEDDGSYLVTSEGYYVLDGNLQRIILSGVFEGISERLGIFDFPNATGLYEVGGSKYAVSESSGEAELKADSEVRQYHLEASNVDLAKELTGMIRAQRAYQAAARALSTADEMEATANNIRSNY